MSNGVTRKRLWCSLACLGILLSACTLLSPNRELPPEQRAPIFKAPTLSPPGLPGSELPIQSTPEPTQVPGCSNDLDFLEDLTVPDGMLVDPGTTVEKEWKVKNPGTCNWNSAYSLHLISGSELGVDPIQALIPARNGTETVIRLDFTAPAEPGRYEAKWQACDPDGKPFGEWMSIAISVTSPQ